VCCLVLWRYNLFSGVGSECIEMICRLLVFLFLIDGLVGVMCV